MFHPLLYFFGGVVGGVFTGLVPGIHPNSVLFLSFPLYSSFGALEFVAFVSGLAISNTIIDFIPSIFIGVPEADTTLSILPGHRFVLEGLGYYALKLTIFGAFFSTIGSLLFLLLFFSFIEPVYIFLKEFMAFILIFFISFLVLKEERMLWTLFAILLSGLLGFLALNSSLSNSQNILFALFGGLFAAPHLIRSFSHRGIGIVREKAVEIGGTFKGGFLGFLASLLVGFIPGIGSSQSALLIGSVFRMGIRDFMVFVGGINTSGMFLSFVALYLIGRTRTGASVALQNVLGDISFNLVFQLVGWSMLAVGTSGIICLILGKTILQHLNFLGSSKLNLSVLSLLVLGSVLLNGLFGFTVFITATCIGFLTLSIGVKRGFLMGVLLVPTILFYLGFGVIIL